YELFSKKEVARYERERKKLEKNLSGIKEMNGLPDALFVIDTRLETIAVKEAVKLGIPIIGVADTNCDPDQIDYIIPGNDDALRAIRLMTDTVAQAYLDGKSVYDARRKEIAEQQEKQRQIQAQQAAAAREAASKAAAQTVDAVRGAGDAVTAESGTRAAGAAQAGDHAAKPKITVRKALQRKSKVRKTAPVTAGVAGENAEAGETPAVAAETSGAVGNSVEIPVAAETEKEKPEQETPACN
ncbi:MAG TPA: 30S ribosomal protein S2, partial [Acidobacteriota bacterium]|nr:30S ribosomal protein S2 [Acidobacteriota bacterium]